MSNAFSVPLILEQVFGAAALYLAAVIVTLVRTALNHGVGGFDISGLRNFLLQSDNSNWLNNLFNTFTYFSYMFIPFVIIAAVLRQNPFKTVPFKIRRPKLLLPAIVIGLAFSVVGQFYSSYFEAILSYFKLQVQLDQFSFPNNAPALVVYFIELSVFAPVCEEFIFRGLIMQNLRRYGNFFAVLMSSLMFGLLHGNLDQTPFAFVVGVALGLTVIETGSIFSSMLLHSCINTVSLVFSFIAYYGSDDLSDRVYALYVFAIFVLAVLCLMSLKKRNFFYSLRERYFGGELPAPVAVKVYAKTPGFIVFAVFYVALMLLSLKPL